jgi:predicted hydrocarbon binding protein
MHGVVHRELKEYVDERIDDGAWERVRDAAGIEPKLYLPVSHYPDEEFTALIDVIAGLSGHDRETVLTNFGRFLAPELLSTFRSHVRDGWDALDLLEGLPAIYERIDGGDDEADLPTVNCDRVVSDMVVLTYRSERELCHLGVGILQGIGDEYDENLSIEQDQCRHEGDDRCEFTIERV